MTIRARLEAETDGLATAGWLLPACFTIVALPIADYAFAARRAANMATWAVVAAATFGGFAWLVFASAFGADVGVPFPLTGTVSPAP